MRGRLLIMLRCFLVLLLVLGCAWGNEEFEEFNESEESDEDTLFSPIEGEDASFREWCAHLEIQPDTQEVGYPEQERSTSFVGLPILSQRFGRGRSYRKGFESAGFVGTFFDNSCYNNWFIDLQILCVDYKRVAGSYGVGWRTTLMPTCDLFGLNIFYDFRSQYHHCYQQIGVGIEYFSRLFDWRVNSYLPIGSRSKLYKSTSIGFEDITLLVEDVKVAMWGLDIEFGKCFCFKNGSLFAGIGPYFYDVFEKACCSKSLLGGMGRISTTLCRYVNLDFLLTYDRIFKGCAQFQVSFTLPCGCASFSPCSRVQRNPIIITTSNCRFHY